jgi:hypothetical protein
MPDPKVLCRLVDLISTRISMSHVAFIFVLVYMYHIRQMFMHNIGLACKWITKHASTCRYLWTKKGLLSCVNKSFCSGMKVIFSIEPSSDLVITILNSRTLDNFYWIFVPQLHATGDILNLNGAVFLATIKGIRSNLRQVYLHTCWRDHHNLYYWN